MDSSASRTASEWVSTFECATTVRTPISRHVRMIRTAISPRLAMRIFENRAYLEGSMRKSGWPYSTAWPFSTRIFATRPATFASISFMSFIASMMQTI